MADMGLKCYWKAENDSKLETDGNFFWHFSSSKQIFLEQEPATGLY